MTVMPARLILTAITAACGLVAPAVAATEHVYDSLNRLNEIRYDVGRSLRYVYDEAGNLSSIESKAAIVKLDFQERADTGSNWHLHVTLEPRDAAGNHGTFDFGRGRCTGTLTYRGRDNQRNYVFQENHLTGDCYKVCDVVLTSDARAYNERCYGGRYDGTPLAPINRRWFDPHPNAAQVDDLLGLNDAPVGEHAYVSVADFKPSSLNLAADTINACRYGLVYNAPPYNERPNMGEWNVPIATPGTYRLRVRYSAVDSRPVVASMDGTSFNSNALAGTNGTWCSAPLIDEAIGDLTLEPGDHTLRLQRGSVFPHLQRIVLERIR